MIQRRPPAHRQQGLEGHCCEGEQLLPGAADGEDRLHDDASLTGSDAMDCWKCTVLDMGIGSQKQFNFTESAKCNRYNLYSSPYESYCMIMG